MTMGQTILTHSVRAHSAPVAVAWVGAPFSAYLDQRDPADPWGRTHRQLLYSGAYSRDRAEEVRARARFVQHFRPLPGVNNREIGPADVPGLRTTYRWGVDHGPGVLGAGTATPSMVAELDPMDAQTLMRSKYGAEFRYVDPDRQRSEAPRSEATFTGQPGDQEPRHHQHGRSGHPDGGTGATGLVLARLLRPSRDLPSGARVLTADEERRVLRPR